MKTRRGFLANIGGIATVPFLGKIVEANQEDVEEYGQSNIYLDKRELKASSYTEITLKVKIPIQCDWCFERMSSITRLLDTNKYHIYGNSNVINSGLSTQHLLYTLENNDKCILLAASVI